MTEEQRAEFYENRQRYRWKCEDFKKDLFHFFENYKPKTISQQTKIAMSSPISIDVKTTQGWVGFNTIKEAAEFIGVSHSFLTVCLRKDKPCMGYELRPHQDDVIFTRQRQAYKESCQEFENELKAYFQSHPTHSLAR